MKRPDITIVTVATDRYIDFWNELFDSALEYLDPEISAEWVVFTNKAESLSHKVLSSRIKVTPINQESLEWPLPTLLRYKLIHQNTENICGKIVMHLDADMLFVAPLQLSDLMINNSSPFIRLIKHPGYFRPKGFARLNFYLRNPRFFVRDIKTLACQNAMGTWENRKKSLAYVPRSSRKNYVCGGAWLGTRDLIFEMSSELSDRVDQDFSQGIIAIYHDESHLNWYASNYKVEIGSPSLCFEPTYPQLIGIPPLIRAVNKSEKEIWIRK
jgi:hypothetical protein